jgi:hypothetical protein
MQSIFKSSLVVLVIVAALFDKAAGQSAIPEVLMKGPIVEQFGYLDEKTRIYENYRAIREDMFQLLKKNSLDSIAVVKGQITILAGMNKSLLAKNDSLTMDLDKALNRLDEAVDTKNSISILGMDVDKNIYNTVMWIIIAVLAFLLGTGFLSLKRAYSVSASSRKELEALNKEFEAYRQKTRIEREKMSMDHFNEIKKLKGK